MAIDGVPATGELQTAVLPLGEWQPDAPNLPGNANFRTHLNLIPLDNGAYGPEMAFETFESTQITAVGSALKFHGSMHSVPPGATSDGEPRYYAGTFATGAGSSRLVSRLETGGWTDKSVAGGYNCTAFTPWRFCNFGIKVLAVNPLTGLQTSEGGSTLFSNVAGAPRAADCATVRGFLALVNINDLTHGEGRQPFYVWWSGIANAELWPDPASDQAQTVQSGFRPLFGGGPLKRIIPGIGGADAIVVGTRKMWRMRYVGAPLVFDFDEIEGDLGTSVPGSIAVLNETFFFYGFNHYWHFDGANSSPIGAGKVDTFFLRDLNASSLFGFQNAIEAAIDPENKCYVVSYRNNQSPDDHNNRILRYNWQTNRWGNGAVAADVLCQVDSNASATDSPRFLIVAPDFQTKRPSAVPLEATVEFAEQMSDRGQYYEICGVMPITDASAPTVTVKVRDFLRDTPLSSAPQGLQRTGWASFQGNNPTGRFWRCLVTFSGVAWQAITALMYQYREHSEGTRNS